MNIPRFLLLVGWLATPVFGAPPVPGQAGASVEFNRDVRPILADKCFHCHGPDASHRKGKLRLDDRDAALAREAFVPGRVDQSELAQRIRSRDPEEVMPPPDEHKALTESEKVMLERWLEQGATYQRHWAYEPPVRPAIPAGVDGIDFLVGQRLAAIGLQPAREADRRTLIRRLHADLVGLPPTPAEVDAFAFDTAPGAYERLVDRLLANPHYGERMAVGWLDVVRYADTIGYHSDNPRNVWPYRDWVIRSFNENKRFDRFTLEQIAGDLLPDANRESRIGSAFNRLLLSTEEGGAQAKDYEARMLTDRVRALGTAWLGQTTGCAQCHDHKFDPFSARDFYALGAFFADVKELSVGRREDGMLVLDQAQEAKLSELNAAVARAKQALVAVAPALAVAQAAWETAFAAGGAPLAELRPGAKAPVADVRVARQVAATLQKAPAARTGKEVQMLRDYYQAKVGTLHGAERDALATAERARKAYLEDLPKCLVTESAKDRRVVRLLPRGNWMDESGDVLRPALPHYLPQPPSAGRELNRLDLARWLVARENPLTARTVVNRWWGHFFGTPLSRNPADLGTQGEMPRHLALLDWLACAFMDSGWDVKQLVRTFVTSATYRQSSDATPAQLAADPDNREHARQSRFRVEAELVRDQALAVAGLLSPRVGGPSVKPYQPDRYWENLNFPPRDYAPNHGEEQYRRGLYVWWQRTFLHPSLLAFDAPSREECVADRGRSNLPQQALVLLNDPTYVEAARSFAARILTEGGSAVEPRLRWAWARALQRLPRADETALIQPLLEAHLAAYRADPAAAAALVATGEAARPEKIDPAELAAWTHVARVLLNLHEFITRS